MTQFVFFVASAIVLAGGMGVVLARNPVHSALFLVQTLVGVAVLFLLLNAELLAAVQVIVYAGAIVVLFLFVIMLLGVDKEERLDDPVRFQRPAALVLGALAFALLLVLVGHQWATGAKTAGGVPLEKGDFGNNIERVARVLFTDFLWPFEVTAALLVIAVVGSVVLARRSGQRPDQPADPQPAQDEEEAAS